MLSSSNSNSNSTTATSSSSSTRPGTATGTSSTGSTTSTSNQAVNVITGVVAATALGGPGLLGHAVTVNHDKREIHKELDKFPALFQQLESSSSFVLVDKPLATSFTSTLPGGEPILSANTTQISQELQEEFDTISNDFLSPSYEEVQGYKNPIDITDVSGFASKYISPPPHNIEISFLTSKNSRSLVHGYNGLTTWTICGILRIKNHGKEEVLFKSVEVKLDATDGGRYKTLLDTGDGTGKMCDYGNVLATFDPIVAGQYIKLPPESSHYSRFEFTFPFNSTKPTQFPPSYHLRTHKFGFYTRYRLTAITRILKPESSRTQSKTIDLPHIHDVDVPYFSVDLIKKVMAPSVPVVARTVVPGLSSGSSGFGFGRGSSSSTSSDGDNSLEPNSGYEVVVRLPSEYWYAQDKVPTTVSIETTTKSPTTTTIKITTILLDFLEVIAHREPSPPMDNVTPSRIRSEPSCHKEYQIPSSSSSSTTPTTHNLELKIPPMTTWNVTPKMNISEINPDGKWEGCVVAHFINVRVRYVLSGGRMINNLFGGKAGEVEVRVPVFIPTGRREAFWEIVEKCPGVLL
ncbi:hypothetical protein HDU76_000211 [Blyttiomyces sp. JEL0837]|nr:hypothetical protein HDU76_000211 [Blyttiomyces sp. JEL0837]